MSVFFVALKTPVEPDFAQQLSTRALTAFGATNVKDICPGQLLISSDSFYMPDSVAKQLGDDFSNGSLGSYIIVPVPAYWGYHDRNIWGFMKEKGL